jgi:hypothetical protein
VETRSSNAMVDSFVVQLSSSQLFSNSELSSSRE